MPLPHAAASVPTLRYADAGLKLITPSIHLPRIKVPPDCICFDSSLMHSAAVGTVGLRQLAAIPSLQKRKCSRATTRPAKLAASITSFPRERKSIHRLAALHLCPANRPPRRSLRYCCWQVRLHNYKVARSSAPTCGSRGFAGRPPAACRRRRCGCGPSTLLPPLSPQLLSARQPRPTFLSTVPWTTAIALNALKILTTPLKASSQVRARRFPAASTA